MFTSASNEQLVHETLEYWTPERLAQVAPVPIIDQASPDTTRSIAGGASPVPDPTSAPWRAIGKMFYNIGGSDYVACACVIDRDLILTAAHCLYDPRQHLFAQQIMFVPAYTNGTKPFGAWTYSQTSIPEAFRDTGDFSWDFGVVRLFAGGSGGSNVGDTVGQLGYQTDVIPSGASWNEVGYPTNYAGGSAMFEETGAYTRTNGAQIVGRSGTFSVGADGAPWLMPPPTRSGNPVVNGLHAFVDATYPNEVFSPSFDARVSALIEWMEQVSA